MRNILFSWFVFITEKEHELMNYLKLLHSNLVQFKNIWWKNRGKKRTINKPDLINEKYNRIPPVPFTISNMLKNGSISGYQESISYVSIVKLYRKKESWLASNQSRKWQLSVSCKIYKKNQLHRRRSDGDTFIAHYHYLLYLFAFIYSYYIQKRVITSKFPNIMQIFFWNRSLLQPCKEIQNEN